MEVQVKREDVRIAWLAALAISIHILESALPSPLPGVKPGLANIVTIATLMTFGWRSAAWVSLLRVIAGSLLIGTFLSPTFALSLSGAVSSVLVLGVSYGLARKYLGAIGFSVLAAMAHMGGQFLVAYLFFIPHSGLFKLLPVLMTAALIFGTLGGIIANSMIKRMSCS